MQSALLSLLCFMATMLAACGGNNAPSKGPPAANQKDVARRENSPLRNTGDPMATRVNWDLNGKQVEFAASELPPAALGFDYEYLFFLEMLDPVHIKVEGDLPPGLSLLTARESKNSAYTPGAPLGIWGKPTKVGEFEFKVTVQDFASRWAQREVKVSVFEPLEFKPDYLHTKPLSIHGYSRCEIGITGGTSPLTRVHDSHDHFPMGLVATQAFSNWVRIEGHIQELEGTYPFQICLRDATGRMGVLKGEVTVEDNQPRIPDQVFPDGVSGAPFVASLYLDDEDMQGVRAELSIPGICDPVFSDHIEVTPSKPGQYTVKVRLVGHTFLNASTDVVAERTFSWRVLDSDGISILTTELPSVSVGKHLDLAVLASTNHSALEWEVIGGSLPGGCRIEAVAGGETLSGKPAFAKITGTPERTGEFRFVIQASHGDTKSLPQSLSVEVSDTPSLFGISATEDVAILLFLDSNLDAEELKEFKSQLKALVRALPRDKVCLLGYVADGALPQTHQQLEMNSADWRAIAMTWIDNIGLRKSDAPGHMKSLGTFPAHKHFQLFRVITPGFVPSPPWWQIPLGSPARDVTIALGTQEDKRRAELLLNTWGYTLRRRGALVVP